MSSSEVLRELIAKVTEDLNDIRSIAVKIQPVAVLECSRLYDICKTIGKRLEAALAASAGQAVMSSNAVSVVSSEHTCTGADKISIFTQPAKGGENECLSIL